MLEPPAVPPRYFSILAVSGGLLVPTSDNVFPWEMKWLYYCDEVIVASLLDADHGERKVDVVEQLDAALLDSARTGQTLRLWVSELLEAAVRERLPVRESSRGDHA